MTRGRFITLEGGEGSGKSTQIALLKSALERMDIPHLITREPGGEEGAEAIRQLLVTGDKARWDPLAETLLFYAARVQHISRVVQPALAQGMLVICDRFADSTRVYQGSKNISPELIAALHALTLGNLAPDMTFILDIDPAQGLARAKSRADNETRFEGEAFDFHQRVRAGFLAIARNEPGRCKVIDATQPAEAVHAHIRNYLALS